jgi:hypothetical protein
MEQAHETKGSTASNIFLFILSVLLVSSIAIVSTLSYLTINRLQTDINNLQSKYDELNSQYSSFALAPKTVVLFNKTQISLEPPFPFYSLNVSEYRKVWIYYQGVQGDIQTNWGVSFGLSNLTRSDVFFLPDAATFSISNEIPTTLGVDVQGPYLFIICRSVGPGQNDTNSIFLYLT